MSESILTEEEIDTLLDGVSNGDLKPGVAAIDPTVSVFDFNQQHNIIVSRLPKIEIIFDEYIKGVRNKLTRVYKKEVDVQLAYLHTRRFSDYQQNLPNPSNLNLVSISPFNQVGLIILDSKILYILVDQYFGGTGDLTGRVETKAFSPIELKMSEQFVNQVLDEWKLAWEGTSPMLLDVIGREDNPDVVQLLGNNDVILQAVFQVGFNGNYGEFQVAIPYSILESLREKLIPESSKKQGADDGVWRDALAKEISTSQVSLSSSIDNLSITLQELIELSPGDVVPIDMPESICLFVEGLPIFEGRLGAFNGMNAIEIERAYSHTRPVKTAKNYTPQSGERG